MEKEEGFVKAEEIDFNDTRQVLKGALENEIKGRKLYLQYANTTKSELAKKVFEHLAADELVHIEDIKKFLESENMDAGVDTAVMTAGTSLENTEKFFGKLVSDLKDQVNPGDDDNKSREVAMDLEKAGFEYYKKASEATGNEKLTLFFEWLMEQEQSHFMLIRNAFEYANDPASWHAEQEHWLLEG